MEVIEDADEEVVAERSGHRWDIIGRLLLVVTLLFRNASSTHCSSRRRPYRTLVGLPSFTQVPVYADNSY